MVTWTKTKLKLPYYRMAFLLATQRRAATWAAGGASHAGGPNINTWRYRPSTAEHIEYSLRDVTLYYVRKSVFRVDSFENG